MKNFKNLKKLTLELNTEDTPETPFLYSSKIFSECPRLTHLTFKSNVNPITDQFFDDIGKHLPNLRVLNVWDADISDKALTSVQELKYLKELHLANTNPTKINKNNVYDLMSFCPNINSIDLQNFETLDINEFKTYTEFYNNTPKTKMLSIRITNH